MTGAGTVRPLTETDRPALERLALELPPEDWRAFVERHAWPI